MKTKWVLVESHVAGKPGLRKRSPTREQLDDQARERAESAFWDRLACGEATDEQGIRF